MDVVRPTSRLPRAAAPIAPVRTIEPATPLRGNVGQFFAADDYPPKALRRNEQGRTVAGLTVTPTGTVSRCIVRKSSGSAILDTAACRIALGAIFATVERAFGT